MLKWIITVIVYAVLTIALAAFLGWIAGIYQASREASFRRRALKLFGSGGKTEEFFIASGDSELVEEIYRVVIATTARVEERQAAQSETNIDEGIAIDDKPTEQNTNRSDRT